MLAARRSISILALCLLVSACGGGSEPVASTPPPPPAAPPPPPPPPPAPATYAIFPAPPASSQEFTIVGADPDQPSIRIRYDSVAGLYELMLPGRDWAALANDENGLFATVDGRRVGLLFTPFFNDAPDPAYRYSRLLQWNHFSGTGGETDYNIIAVGQATPASAVPVTGSAHYGGEVWGAMPGALDPYTTVIGDVDFTFDFGGGCLNGEMRTYLQGWGGGVGGPDERLAFSGAIASGTGTFSGKFITDRSGPNSFSGLFTGPSAQELIGRWAVSIRDADNTLRPSSGV